MKNVIGVSFTVFVLTFLAIITHEGAHFAVAKVLGNESIISINHVRPVSGEWNSLNGARLISAAGPIWTIILGLLGFIWAIKQSSLMGLNIVLVAFIQRLLAAAVSLNNPNDEMWVGTSLGLDPWTLPIAVVAILLIMSVVAFRKTKPGSVHLIGVWLGSSIALMLIVFGEQYFPMFTS
jgi:hypothetical protein